MAGLGPVGGYKTVRELAGGQVLDVQYCETTTTPSGFGFAYALPYDAFIAGAVAGNPGPAGRDLLLVIASQLEELGANHHMTGSTGVQDFDTNGLLADFVDATVTVTTNGIDLSSSVLIPVQAFFAAEPGIGGQTFPGPGGVSPVDLVDSAYNGLVALAGG